MTARAAAALVPVLVLLAAPAPGAEAGGVSDAHAGHDMHEMHDMHGQEPVPQDANAAHAGHDQQSHAASGPVTPVPPITEEMRRAAFAEVGDMREHMSDDPIHYFLLVDRLERQGGEGDEIWRWDQVGWIGRDFNRLWIRSEGERTPEGTDESTIEALWGRPVSRWWDFVAGLRHDFKPGDGRNWLGAGVVGTAPYRFEVDATAYVGEGGATALELQAEYDFLLTNRLILQPRAALTAYGRSDARRAQGSGLSTAEAGLRLRYEIRREFGPYVGVEWSGSFGPTADLRRRYGESADALHYVAGLRFWF